MITNFILEQLIVRIQGLDINPTTWQSRYYNNSTPASPFKSMHLMFASIESNHPFKLALRAESYSMESV